jgi:hypothetical protein
MRKLRHRGVCKVHWIFTLAFAAYNLVRMRNLAAAVPAVQLKADVCLLSIELDLAGRKITKIAPSTLPSGTTERKTRCQSALPQPASACCSFNIDIEAQDGVIIYNNCFSTGEGARKARW